ncbi:MAG TPA: phosphoribosylanthranilate isomerase [Flavobacteriales bacterium]|nr:phosphoribosylanthranilate isomerase [Flavobacteriales bacterium]
MIVGAGNIHVKICGNTNPVNIEAMAALGPDIMGFIFYEGSIRNVNVEQVKPIVKAIRHIHKTGVFVNALPEYIIKVVREMELDSVQLHGHEDPYYCATLKENVPVIKALDGAGAYLEKVVELYKGCVDFYLIDTMGKNYGGSGVKFNHERLKNINFHHPFFVAGGLNATDAERVRMLKSIPGFYGIDINSQFESQPGIKDIEKVKLFLNQIR